MALLSKIGYHEILMNINQSFRTFFEENFEMVLSYFFDPEVQRAWHMLILSPICYR